RGEYADAAAALQQVVDSNAATADVRTASWKLLADLYERLGELHLAAVTLEAFAADAEAEAGDSTRADAWYRAGELYRKHDRNTEDAERCLEAALAVVRDHLPALDSLERIKREAGEHERVAVILGRKIAASAGHPGRQKALLGRLAALQLELGRADVAREVYRRALEIDPAYRPALELLAAEAAASGEAGEAMRLYARLAADLPGDSELPDDPATLEQARIDA